MRKKCIVSGLVAVASGSMIGVLEAFYGVAHVHDDLGIMSAVVICTSATTLAFGLFLYYLAADMKIRGVNELCIVCGLPLQPDVEYCDNCGYDMKEKCYK